MTLAAELKTVGDFAAFLLGQFAAVSAGLSCRTERLDICMGRTTLLLDDTQMTRLKNLARAQGRTMTDLINVFIAEGLAARATPKSEKVLTLPVFDMGPPRVNLADREALEAIME